MAESGDTLGAWKKFLDALQLVPEPKTDWEATTWLLASIGDMAFVRGKFDKARDALEDAVRCPNGLGNAFIHLRLGETLFELGDRSAQPMNLCGRTWRMDAGCLPERIPNTLDSLSKC